MFKIVNFYNLWTDLLESLLTDQQVSYHLNTFPHRAILQWTIFRKILNVHSAERNEPFSSLKALKTLWQKKKFYLQEQFLPMLQFFQMSSAAAKHVSME